MWITINDIAINLDHTRWIDMGVDSIWFHEDTGSVLNFFVKSSMCSHSASSKSSSYSYDVGQWNSITRDTLNELKEELGRYIRNEKVHTHHFGKNTI